MFGTNFCGLRSYTGNQVLCTCTIIRCPFRNACALVCRSIEYFSALPAGTAQEDGEARRRKLPPASRQRRKKWGPPPSTAEADTTTTAAMAARGDGRQPRRE